jgi:hypothetical protein
MNDRARMDDSARDGKVRAWLRVGLNTEFAEGTEKRRMRKADLVRSEHGKV